MNENTTAKEASKVFLFPENVDTVHKRIGNTTYVVTTGFNGDARWDMASALVRLAVLEVIGNFSSENAENR